MVEKRGLTAQFTGSLMLPAEFGDCTIHCFEEIDSRKGIWFLPTVM